MDLKTTRCRYCWQAFAVSLDRCPHCGLPGLFPNVAMADNTSEREALQQRYDGAVRDAAKRGAEQKVQDFEATTASSMAVLARSVRETERLADGDHEGYATYYQLVEAEVRLPKGEKWDVLRRVTDAALFSGYEKKIRFAALSLNGTALENYGDFSWVLKETMIDYRASVFEENSVLFMEHHEVSMSQAHELPRGHRATWAERSKLCVAKLASKIDGLTPEDEFPGLLMRQGKTPEDDDFVEVHIGGPMTARTLERVIVMKGSRRKRRSLARALEAKLGKLGVALES